MEFVNQGTVSALRCPGSNVGLLVGIGVRPKWSRTVHQGLMVTSEVGSAWPCVGPGLAQLALAVDPSASGETAWTGAAAGMLFQLGGCKG